MRKLLGKPTADSSHDANPSITSSPLPAVYRPNVAQNAAYVANVPIACFDSSPDGRSVILAGRHILKTVTFDGLHIKESLNVRSLITAYSSSRTGAASSTSDQLSIRDVKWATGPNDTTIFTACANGRIVQYDLARLAASLQGGPIPESIQMREDSRQINTLDVNPHRGSILLSGSQDGLVRYFDIRAPVATRTGSTFRAVQVFKCNAEGVRHVKWSPKDGFYFACATEQGVVLKWDIRKPNAPMLRINGHDKACTSISWHPDGDHLISAGSDSKCHVWDMSKTAEKRQKAKWSISTLAPVAAISWRPGQWSASGQGRRAAQVAVCYDESSKKTFGINAVHIWDLARPTMPYKEILRFDSSPSALQWHDRDLLWTAGQDGQFCQCDVAFSPKVIDRTPVSTMAFSSQGEVLMLLDERPPATRPRPPAVRADMLPSSSYGSSPTAPMLSISRSDSEDDVVGSFLGPRRRAGRKRRPSTRSTHTLSTTPPSGPGSEEAVIPLEQSLKITGFYKSQQAMAIGPVPSATKAHVYQYLSSAYLEALANELPWVAAGPPMPDRLAVILEHYARAAETVGQFRLAQTWRILAFATDLLLRRRALYHLEKRTRLPSATFTKWDGNAVADDGRNGSSLLTVTPEGDETPRKVPSSTNLLLLEKPIHVRSLLAEEIESTSNVATPLARPVSDEIHAQHEIGHIRYAPGKQLTPVLETDSFSLPPAVRALPAGNRQRLDSMPLSDISQGSENTQVSSTEGYDFYDTEAMAKAIDVPHVKKKELPADYIEPRSPSSQRKQVLRHDSDESFAQMFSISQTSGHSNSSAGSIPKKPSRLGPNMEDKVSKDSEAIDGEYHSRIRGRELEDSPGSSHVGLLRRALERTSTNLTATTDEDYHMTTQTTSDSMASHRYYSRSDGANSGSIRQPGGGVRSSTRASQVSDDGDSERVVETDFLPWADDPPYPYPIDADAGFSPRRHPAPLEPYTVISRALSFETRSSALNASAMVLLLKPLVPDEVFDSFQARAILRQHHSRLMGMKLFVEAALLRKLCIKGWPGGVLSAWGEDYSSIFSQAQQGVRIGFSCPRCHKPREMDRSSKSAGSVWLCERCRAVMGPCAVCGHRDTTPNVLPAESSRVDSSEPSAEMATPVLSTWWYCSGCGHGGHSTCLEGWHGRVGLSAAENSPLIGSPAEHHSGDVGAGGEFSDGCCPMDGCGHACLPGRWRTETVADRSEEMTRAVRESTRSATKTYQLGAAIGERDRRFSVELGAIRGDNNEVGQSRAVDSVRESLAGDRDTGGVLSSSPRRAGGERERERRKSVKFASAEERK